MGEQLILVTDDEGDWYLIQEESKEDFNDTVQYHRDFEEKSNTLSDEDFNKWLSETVYMSFDDRRINPHNLRIFAYEVIEGKKQ